MKCVEVHHVTHCVVVHEVLSTFRWCVKVHCVTQFSDGTLEVCTVIPGL